MATFNVRIGQTTPAEVQTAISTGAILGGGRSTDAFYISYNNGTDWELTYSHAQNEVGAAGKLMNLRTVQAAWFNDASGANAQDMTEQDATDNTDLFCAQFPTYRASGLLAVSVSMEGGNPQNSDSDPDISQTGFSYDGANGTPSAFSKGPVAIKASWQARLEQIIEAANAQGMIVILGLFYGRQTYWLSSQANYRAAMAVVTDWLIAKGYRNIVVNLANEAGEGPSSTWGAGLWSTDSGAAGEIDHFVGLWTGEPWRPPVGVSNRAIDTGALTGAAADVILPHANLTAGGSGLGSPTVTTLNNFKAAWPDQPIVFDEDSPREVANPSVADSLTANALTCSRCFTAGMSWGGFMSHHQRWHSDWNDADGHPFEWRARATADVTTGTYRDRAMGHTRGILDHIETLTGGLPLP